ncbi:sugar kinase [Paenibacillus sp. HN-1]|uniref:carbohydrate kinase family protein n=1 Tax=Paenibacillus TaxID=44249 RepID=UPI001CA7EAA5|nr:MULTISPECIES: sugar kinase [Paenibacillus]MBY9079123.1 sugar kinase [Paenibacillus sp. CGMCC 1.18879]MBY9086901.1 sugar kinase [Paenibacillus sinensis]
MFEFEDRVEFPERNLDILTVGEMLVDMISEEYGDSFESRTYRKFFGGSPSNIAMNVKQLGARPLVASAVGADGLGHFLIEHLKEAGIDTRCVQQVEESTSMVLITKSRATPIPIFYRGADYQLAYTPELKEALERTKIVHFSCWPLSRKPVRQTMEEVMRDAGRNGVLICFDPNYHPMLWEKGEDGARYVKSILRHVDIAKPSEDDAQRLFGADTPENQLRKFLDLGVKLVILTLGKDGALVSNGKETVKFDTLAKDVADTTGAGDAFWSGFYAALVKGYPIRRALKLGMAVSAYKLQYMGAVVDLPKLVELEQRYQI